MSNEAFIAQTSDELKSTPSTSEWDAATAVTDKDIDAADKNNPDLEEIDETWMENAAIPPPRKKPVYALYDEYVIDYFKQGGKGYQTRMNAVLKAYVDAQLQKQPRQ